MTDTAHFIEVESQNQWKCSKWRYLPQENCDLWNPLLKDASENKIPSRIVHIHNSNSVVVNKERCENLSSQARER